MGVQKKTRKFAQVKRIIGKRDARLKKNQEKDAIQGKKKDEDVIREVYDHSQSL
jgi:U3 small nucleolar RNA-associated protein 24